MIVFRVDGNKNIGLGHVMRCLSIAVEFRNKGKECYFLIADNSCYDIIKAYDFSIEILHTDYVNMEEELTMTSLVLEKLSPEKVIIDSYFVTEHYLGTLRKKYCLVYIDDLASFAYPVDQLINYNIYGKDIDYKSIYQKVGMEIPKMYLGVSYVPLREEFKSVLKCQQTEQCRNIFISTGGADSIHLILNMLRFLQENPKESKNFQFHFIVGAMNQDLNEIEYLAEKNKNIHLYKNVSNMSLIMQKCDIAVSAAGSTLYELCACGIPVITYVLADNQKLGANAFMKSSLMISLGDLRSCTNIPQMIFDAINKLDNNYELRKRISEKICELIDAHGANRLVNDLYKS